MNQRNLTYISNRRNFSPYNYGRNKNISAFQSTIKLGPITNTIMIGLMITVLGLIYLTQVVRITTYDYDSNQFDSQIAELVAKKTDLEVEKARLTSLETLQNSSVAQNMTPVSETKYIRN